MHTINNSVSKNLTHQFMSIVRINEEKTKEARMAHFQRSTARVSFLADLHKQRVEAKGTPAEWAKGVFSDHIVAWDKANTLES